MSALMFVLDVVIIVLLAATIFYAIRLAKHLSVFRANRSEMERLIRELSTQVTRAQEGISVLDDISSTQGDKLRQMVARAQGLYDELEIMTEAGNSLAERLEKLASKNRAIADDMGQSLINTVYPGQKSREPQSEKSKYEDSLPRAEKERVVPSLEPSFAIRDPDYGDDDDGVVPFGDEEGGGFMSKAERDLAAALKKRGRK